MKIEAQAKTVATVKRELLFIQRGIRLLDHTIFLQTELVDSMERELYFREIKCRLLIYFLKKMVMKIYENRFLLPSFCTLEGRCF